jgi:hypothetical protein
MKQVIKVSQCENEVLVSDRLCSKLNVDGNSNVCEVNENSLMVGVYAGGSLFI